MPQHVQKILNNPNGKLAEIYENVTIIYADICGFTQYSSDKEPQQVVSLLSKLFTNFDKKCNDLDIYKVYTIGDCYVALGFIENTKRVAPHQEAYKVIQFAFHMIKIIMKVREEINFPQLDMRIGIHTGKVIGGVIGTDIIRFDIYGKDVAIANEMESEGMKGCINISEDTKKLVEQNYKDLKFKLYKKYKNYDREFNMYFVDKLTNQLYK